MSITTTPVFYYISAIDDTNFYINFKEPNQANTELSAELNAGSYSVSELASEVARALNAIGQQLYSVSFDRNTRSYTISSDDTVELLAASGSQSGLSAYSLLGFSSIDLTGAFNYTGDQAAGTEYKPQFALQGFIGFEDDVQAISPSVNQSSSGVVEVITYGTVNYMSFNIKYANDYPHDKGSSIAYDPNGVQNLRDFMSFCITKGNLEFMKDSQSRGEFDIVLLESTPASRTGTGYRLRELYSQNLLGYYETGNVKFRKIS